MIADELEQIALQVRNETVGTRLVKLSRKAAKVETEKNILRAIIRSALGWDDETIDDMIAKRRV